MRSKGCDWELWVLSPINERRQLEPILKSQKVDGVIGRGLSQELIGCVNEAGIPLVAIRGLQTPDDAEINGPHVDDAAIGSIAGDEFMRLNLGYWGFVHWDGVGWSEERRKSFHSHATSIGASNSTVSLSLEERSSWDGISKMVEWVKGLPKPCGVLACNDEAGVDVLHACQIAGLTVPDEVAVIGVDNDRLLCESAVPPLSSIDLHAVEVGKAAALQLRDNLSNDQQAVAPQPVGSASMVVRESSHEVDRYLLAYQRAMDYISAKPLKGASVSEVASACSVSRRGLERAFAKHSGESPAAVIRKQRLAAIIQLLKNQPLSLENIAQQTGFSDAAGLSNFIKRMTGKPPGEFR